MSWPTTSPDPPAADASDRLHGWKEIAAFLCKGVRTAQRWERELGLPVHRIGRERGELVFAYRSARWRRARLDHAFGKADEADFFPLLKWDGARFVELPAAEIVR